MKLVVEVCSEENEDFETYELIEIDDPFMERFIITDPFGESIQITEEKLYNTFKKLFEDNCKQI